MSLIDALTKQLKRDEDTRLRVYDDFDGTPIVTGHTVKGIPTIGTGRNLMDVGIMDEESNLLLSNDIAHVQLQLMNNLPWSQNLDEGRLGVLMNMDFNMGLGRLLQFKQTLELIKLGNYSEASVEMLKSVWATQVGARAHRLAKQMETGQWM